MNLPTRRPPPTLPVGGTLTVMTQPASAQAWFQGGPADGAIRSVECQVDGRPPELLMFCGSDVFVGASDEPALAAHPAYELETATTGEDGFWRYRYVGTLTPP